MRPRITAFTSSPDHRPEPFLHLRPLAIDDAVDGRVAGHPAVAGLVVAQRTFERGADAHDRISRRLVQNIGLELHALAAPGLERVAQHEVLGFGIDVSALEGAANPGPPHLYPPVRGVDGAETRGTYGPAARPIDGGERQTASLGLLAYRGLEVA